MAVTVQLMQSPCVLTSKALSVTFSPSSGCSRLLGVGRGGSFAWSWHQGRCFWSRVSPPLDIMFLLGRARCSWPLSRLPEPAGSLLAASSGTGLSQFVLPAQPLLLAALAAPGSQVVATFHVPLSHVGSPPCSLGASRALVRVVGVGGPLTVQTYPAIPSIYTIHPRDGVSLCVQRSRQEAW